MPKPDLKIGTRETVSGAIVVVSYSKPRGVLSYMTKKYQMSAFRNAWLPHEALCQTKRTFGPGTADSAVASASQPTINEIS